MRDPCETCMEYGFCKVTQFPCWKRKRYIQHQETYGRIAEEIKKTMERARKERDDGTDV